MIEKDNFIIFVVNGGAGKNVLATAVVKAVKYANPDSNIIILSAYKEIWMYNPNVYRTYVLGQTNYFYNDYIKGKKNVRIMALEPYSTSDYILKDKHLIEIWCDLVGVKYNGEKPELFFNQREIEYCENFYQLKQSPIFLIQTNGGAKQDTKISWVRDLPLSTAQEVVNVVRQNYRVIHIRRNDQPEINGVEQFQGGLRDLMVLIKYSQKRLFIDSVCQHIASALDKPSTVLWVKNAPTVLGYSLHDNIVTTVEDEMDILYDGVLEQYDITGNIYQCPYKEGTKLFDTEDVLRSIRNQTNESAISKIDKQNTTRKDKKR